MHTLYPNPTPPTKFARGISNASVHLANNLTSWKQQLLARMSTQQQAAKSNMVSEHIPVEAEAKEMYVCV